MSEDKDLALGLAAINKRLGGVESFLGTELGYKPEARSAGSSVAAAPAAALVAATAPVQASAPHVDTIGKTGLPSWLEDSVQVTYRSTGLGVWGAVLRYGGMPLEKIAIISVAM